MSRIYKFALGFALTLGCDNHVPADVSPSVAAAL
jgi:hypothetical protein